MGYYLYAGVIKNQNLTKIAGKNRTNKLSTSKHMYVLCIITCNETFIYKTK